MTSPKVKLLAADYHRNGVGGEGFHVALFRDLTGGRTMLAVSFDDRAQFAVLDVDAAAKGNIFMHPVGDQPGGNAWRGDVYSPLLYQAIRDEVEARYDTDVAAHAEAVTG